MTQRKKLVLVVWSGDLDRVYSAFGIALVAASMGMEATMVFTFWGLNVVKKNEGPIRSKGLMRKMVNFINRGGSKRLGLSRLHMFGLGPWVMKRLLKDSNMPSIDEFITLAKAVGVRLVACTGAWGIMGLTEDCFRDELDAIVGTADWLQDASESSVAFYV